MTHDVKVGLVGYGLAGKVFHAPFIARTRGLRLASVSTTRAAELREEFPDVAVHATPEAVINDPAIDLVVIAAPNAAHFDLAVRAIGQGKHVVIDKPLATSSLQARTLDRMATERGVLLSAFHNRRWDGDFLTLQALIADGVLGDIVRFESGFDRFRPQIQDRWREKPGPAAGVWWDLGPHLVDQALCLFGAPDSMNARIAAERPGALVDDAFEVTLRFGAVEALLFSSCLAETPRPRFVVTGTKARFISVDVDPLEAALRAGLRPGDENWPPRQAPGRLIGAVETEAPILPAEYGAFYAAISAALHSGGENPVSAADAASVLEILERAEKTAR